MIDAMPLKYHSGEEVRAGDRVLYAGEPGTIEFVASATDPETVWYVQEFGGGCMLLVAPFGRLFLSDSQTDEDLDFVARSEPPSIG